MAPKIYGTIYSPPVRAVLLCAKAIDLELDLIEVDLLKGEHQTPEFTKMNPLRTIPVLKDNDFVVVDSHAIMIYLIGTYAKDKSLYPTDVKKRSRIDQMLFFDSGTLFPRHLKNSLAVYRDGVKKIPEENVAAITEAFGYLETLLQGNRYTTGDDLSIADFSILTTVTNASFFAPLDKDKYPNIIAWMVTLKELPYYNINKVGGEGYYSSMKALLLK